MLRQYGENMIHLYKRKFKKKNNNNAQYTSTEAQLNSNDSHLHHFTSLQSTVQSSSLRHETLRCPHDVLLMGAVTATICPPPDQSPAVLGESQLWCISIIDCSGQNVLVLIPSQPASAAFAPILTCRCNTSTSTAPCACAPDCFKSKLRVWECMQSRGKSAAQNSLVVTLANPVVLVEVHPRHNEQSAQVIVVVQEFNVFACWSVIEPSVRRGDHAVVDAHVDSESAIGTASPVQNELQHSLDLGLFVSSRLSHSHANAAAGGVLLRTEQLPTKVAGVREALMVDPLTSPRATVLLPCVRGVVVWKEYTTETGYFYINDVALDPHSSHGQAKRRKLSLPKCVVHLQDINFGDVLYLYLPDTPSAAGACMQHLVVDVFNCKLKLSANKRHSFLEFDINESCIGDESALLIAFMRRNTCYCQHLHNFFIF